MESAGAAALGIFFLIFGVVIFIIGVFMAICQWIIYTKAKQPGWAILIPIYNLIVFLKIVGRPVSWIVWFLQVLFFEIIYIVAPNVITALLFFLSVIATLVFSIIITNGLSKSFGKDAGYTVGLLFLPMVFYPMLAFGKATYIGPGGVPPTDDTIL